VLLVTGNVAVPLPVPPAPIQLSAYCNDPAALGVTVTVPLVAFVPLHPPLAVHDVAFVLDHVSVDDCPSVIDVGLSEIVTVGAGAATVNAAVPLPVPPAPVQLSAYCDEPVALGVTVAVPLVAFVPLHPPLAVHDVAFVLDHVRVDDCPSVTDVGFNEIVTVGAGVAIVSVAVPLPVPPAPVQLNAYCDEPAALGVTVAVPLVAFVPLHAPLAVQEVAFVLDHVRVDDCPSVIDVGLSETVTVGAGGFTVSVVEATLAPPVPEQLNVYWEEPAAPGVTVWDPLTACSPLQAPLAVHEVAFVLDHVSVDDWPSVIEVGLTEIETVGDCCAPPVTVNVALPLPVPPAPVQSRTYCNEPAALGVTVMLPTVC
jgi:hypothetical protein